MSKIKLFSILTSNIIIIIIIYLISNNIVLAQGLLNEIPPANIVQQVYDAIPKINEDLKIERERVLKDEDKPRTHESGVYYEGTDVFKQFKEFTYAYEAGSFKDNIEKLANKAGWDLIWELDVDFKIPRPFTYKNLRFPEHLAELTKHIPVKTVLYSKNKILLMMPMYDKRESDIGEKHSI